MLKCLPTGDSYSSQSASLTKTGRLSLLALACASLLSACNNNANPPPAASAPAPAITAPAAAPAEPVAAAYAPPSADVLYQMVAPIALYPDKLVAQILAGSTYPDQISSAEAWLGQNPALQKAALVSAVNGQSWDPSVKSLTEFPNVLNQMASNLPWTTALGKAYFSDPSDVLNAIQVMRGRAYKAGSLKSSQQLKVAVAAKPAPVVGYTASAQPMPLVNNPVIAPPPDYIEIAPTEVSTVYVPRYDPAVVYGEPVPVYQGYRAMIPPPPPPPMVVGAAPVVAGVIGFGAGVVLATVVENQPHWGWRSWDMHWGDRDHDMPAGGPPPIQARPAVVYNNRTYISQSTTVVENVRNNVHITNVVQQNAAPGAQNAGNNATPAAMAPALPGHGPDHGGLGSPATAAVAAAAVAGGAALAMGNHGAPSARQGLQPPAGPGMQMAAPVAYARPNPANMAADANAHKPGNLAAMPAAAMHPQAAHPAPQPNVQAPHVQASGAPVAVPPSGPRPQTPPAQGMHAQDPQRAQMAPAAQQAQAQRQMQQQQQQQFQQAAQQQRAQQDQLHAQQAQQQAAQAQQRAQAQQSAQAEQRHQQQMQQAQAAQQRQAEQHAQQQQPRPAPPPMEHRPPAPAPAAAVPRPAPHPAAPPAPHNHERDRKHE